MSPGINTLFSYTMFTMLVILSVCELQCNSLIPGREGIWLLQQFHEAIFFVAGPNAELAEVFNGTKTAGQFRLLTVFPTKKVDTFIRRLIHFLNTNTTF